MQIKEATKILNRTAKIQEEFYLEGALTEKQKRNWIPHEDVVKFCEELENTVRVLKVYKKKEITTQERELLQKFIMIAFHGGFCPPPRCEFADLRYFSKKNDAMDWKGNSVFFCPRGFININRGKVKTGILEIPKKMCRILKKYCKFLKDGDYLFVNKEGQVLSTNAYGKRLKKFYLDRYQKTVGASLLRVIYLTKKYRDIPCLKELKSNSKLMMHDFNTGMLYYKKNLALENGRPSDPP